jgi:hypothetical protein
VLVLTENEWPPFGFIERILSVCEVITTPGPSGHALPLDGDR